jgi:prepilin-type processing-associated H-X9-DG protein
MALASKALAGFISLVAASLPAFAACTAIEEKGLRHTACQFQPGEGQMELHNLNKAGEPYRYLSLLAADLAQDGKQLVFAMNAGMYDENNRPIGLYVEEGRTAKKLNRRNGGGNFHLKPNGVFFVKAGKAQVMETEAFAKSGIKPDYASQSGPMLVVNGKIHPKFSETGTSRKLRNGVGVDDEGLVTFVISENAVTFHEFASLFRDRFKASNALFFDGSVSSLYAPEINRNDGFLPLGPMVGVHETR